MNITLVRERGKGRRQLTGSEHDDDLPWVRRYGNDTAVMAMTVDLAEFLSKVVDK